MAELPTKRETGLAYEQNFRVDETRKMAERRGEDREEREEEQPLNPSKRRAPLRFDLGMDLALLRQMRAHDNPFSRGSPSMNLPGSQE